MKIEALHVATLDPESKRLTFDVPTIVRHAYDQCTAAALGGVHDDASRRELAKERIAGKAYLDSIVECVLAWFHACQNGGYQVDIRQDEKTREYVATAIKLDREPGKEVSDADA